MDNSVVMEGNEVKISLDEFKLIKSFYPGFTRKQIASNDIVIGWSELMPVVEKIDAMPETSFEMYPAYSGIGSRVGVGVQITTPRKDFKILVLPNGRTRIEVVYKAVLEFINWYNTIKENQ